MPSEAFAGVASVAVAVTSFTNVSPAAAQRSSGTEAGLSIIEAEICFPRAQSNRRTRKENSLRPGSAARGHERARRRKIETRRRNRSPWEDALSGLAPSVLSGGSLGRSLALVPPSG